MNKPFVSAVMPCLNEAETLAICIDKALACFHTLGIKGEVIVSDNGSTDDSAAIARAHGARVVHQPIRGYGAALMAGIEAATGDIIIIGDADDSYDWSNLAPFIEAIGAGYDLVMGNRFSGGIEPGAMPALHRHLGNPVLSFAARAVCGAPVGDFHCGMRAFTPNAYVRMKLSTPGMEFASEMVIHAARNGLRITEVPIRLFPDKRSRPPHLRSFRDGWRHLRFILTYAPDHLYLFPGLLMTMLGLVLQLGLAMGPIRIGEFTLGIHFLALGGLLTLCGFNILNLGLLGKVIVARKYPTQTSRIAHWAAHGFRLETALIGGGLVAASGLAVDLHILLHWLGRIGQSQPETVHLAFVASTAIVLGLNTMFSAFLLHLLISEGRSAS